VASDLEAFRGFLDDRCARIVPVGDAAALAQALLAVARGERPAVRGRTVARAWSWDAAAAAHEHAYQEFLGLREAA
jgi:glycosyltransferase involved in cell wall biosynthesis